jgi:hypothetical protein
VYYKLYDSRPIAAKLSRTRGNRIFSFTGNYSVWCWGPERLTVEDPDPVSVVLLAFQVGDHRVDGVGCGLGLLAGQQQTQADVHADSFQPSAKGVQLQPDPLGLGGVVLASARSVQQSTICR